MQCQLAESLTAPSTNRRKLQRLAGLFSIPLFSMTLGSLVAFSLVGQALANESDGNGRAQTATTEPYEASYVLTRRGTERGDATRVLEKLENEQWRYFTATHASMLFLSDNRENETVFELHGGRVVPVSFDYSRTGTGSNRSLSVRFDRDNEQVLDANGNPIELEWNADLLDPNAVLHQLQLDVAGQHDQWTYTLVDEKGNKRDYEFERVEQETLRLPYGEVEAIRVDRVRESERRQTHFWFAPELNYTLVKMQQLKEGIEQAQIQLNTLTFNE